MTRAHALRRWLRALRAKSRGAVVLALCLNASLAGAQEARRAITLAPAAVARWDAAGQITWLGERHSDEPSQWDRWLGAASGGGALGYHWTSHLKTELDISTSTEGEIYSYESVLLPGASTPLFIQRDHEIRVTTASVGLIGQFFENAWFHPFAGAGVELVRKREHVETLSPPFSPRPGVSGPIPPSETRVRLGSRPYVASGFKAYFSERAFFRADLRTSWSSDGLAALAWRSGLGVDF
jgi:hypothetical protein